MEPWIRNRTTVFMLFSEPSLRTVKPMAVRMTLEQLASDTDNG